MILNMKGGVGCAGQRESLANPAFVWQEVRREKKKKKSEEAVQETQDQKILGEFCRPAFNFQLLVPLM